MNVLDTVRTLLLVPLRGAAEAAFHYLPNLGIAALVVAVGFPLAIIAREVTARLLRALGFDVLADRTGVTKLLARGGVSRRASRIVGLLAYWVVVFSALILVFNVLGLPSGARLIVQVLGLLPGLVATLLVLSLGMFLARFFGRVVEASSLVAKVPFARLLGYLTRYAVVGLSLVAAVSAVGVVPPALSGTLAIAALAGPIVLAVVLLVASPKTLSSFVAGRYLRAELKPGDRIVFEGGKGEIRAVRLLHTMLARGGDDIIVSNDDLASGIILRSGQPTRAVGKRTAHEEGGSAGRAGS
jgi:hypothetical protein